MSELIVRERRLRTFEHLPRAVTGCIPATESGPAAEPADTSVPITLKRLAARHSRRRVAHDGLDLG